MLTDDITATDHWGIGCWTRLSIGLLQQGSSKEVGAANRSQEEAIQTGHFVKKHACF